jgi:hypothetical protein
MARWWYYTLYKCPECGRTWETYDPTGGNYDSGPSGPVTHVEECEDCFDERCRQDRERDEYFSEGSYDGK